MTNTLPYRNVAGTTWRKIADAIEESIDRGAYPPHDQIPTVMALANEFGVNRHTVRQALQHLQRKGVVSIEQGRGTFVVDRAFDYKIAQRVRLQANLEPSSSDIEGTVIESEQWTANTRSAEHLALPVGQPLWSVTVLRRVNRHPISHSIILIDRERFPDFPRRLETRNGSPTAVFKSYGIADYVRLSTRIEARTADEELEAFLQLPPGVPLIVTRGLDGLPDGSPLQYINTSFASHRVQLVVENPASAE